MTTSAEEAAPSSLGALRVGVEDRPSLARRRRPLRQRLRLPLMALAPLLVLLVAGYWYVTGGRYVSTDDAYIQAARTSISTDVAGRVAAIEVRDNERVTAGQVLFRLDQRPFRIAVDEAQRPARRGQEPGRGDEGDLPAKAGRRPSEPRPRSPISSASSSASSGCCNRAPPQRRNTTRRTMPTSLRATSSPPKSRTLPARSQPSAATPTSRSPSTRWCSTPRRRSTGRC